MHTLFQNWFDKNQDLFVKNGIKTEYVRRSQTDNPSITFEQESPCCLGQISIWESGLLDMEVLHMGNEKTILYEHHEFKVAPNFGDILKNYLKVMKTGEAI
jgi:hypothetical protein